MLGSKVKWDDDGRLGLVIEAVSIGRRVFYVVEEDRSGQRAIVRDTDLRPLTPETTGYRRPMMIRFRNGFWERWRWRLTAVARYVTRT